MNIVGYSASPRKNGNTDWMVRTVLEGAGAHGAATRSWRCGEIDIKPCQSCYGCRKKGQGCVLRDGMQAIFDALEHADALVLGSPIYMGQMSGQAKIFTDRLFARYHPRFSPYFNEKYADMKLVLAFSQGNPDPGKFRVYLDYTRDTFQMLGFDVRGMHLAAGTRAGPACEQEELRAVLLAAGAALAGK